jgi:hypothetical protein
MKKMRSAFGVPSFVFIVASSGLSSPPNFPPPPKPRAPISSERIAFWKDSLKVRPIAITSPTDFIDEVSVGSASGNFSNVNRGIFVTT